MDMTRADLVRRQYQSGLINEQSARSELLRCGLPASISLSDVLAYVAPEAPTRDRSLVHPIIESGDTYHSRRVLGGKPPKKRQGKQLRNRYAGHRMTVHPSTGRQSTCR